MNISQLHAIHQLYLRKTMSAAAEALHLTPSAISQQISILEQELEINLIERRGRGVELTVPGRELVKHAERIFEELQAAYANIASLKNTVAGTLRVSSFPSAGTALLPATTKSLKTAYPQLTLHSRELEPEDAVTALKAWEIDVALIDDVVLHPGLIDANIEVISLISDKFVIMLPASHPLTAFETVPIEELRNEAWVIDAWVGNNYTDVVIGECKKAGYIPNIIAQCKDFTMASTFVKMGCAVFMVAGLRMISQIEGVEFRPLFPELKREISIAFRKSERKSPALRVFIKHIRNRVKELQGM